MAEKDEQIQKFIKLCENSSFPHREELLRGIKNEDFIFERAFDSEVPSEQLLDVYRVRAKIVARKTGDYAKKLKDAILKFVSELEKHPDERVKFWLFTVNSPNKSSNYSIFEGVNSKVILGCLETFDRREVSESDWEQIWSE